MAEDINYGAILESLNDKVDLGGSWSAPSSSYDDLILGASGNSYTAPADGYFAVDKVSGATNTYFAFNNIQTGMWITVPGPGSGNACRCFMPAKKGDTVAAYYNASGATNMFRFIYAQKTN